MSKSSDAPTPLDALEQKELLQNTTRFRFRLYTAGPTPQSTRALVNIRRICEEHLKGRYDLEVVDLLENPEVATQDQIIAAPTLAKLLPLPTRRFIGDLSQTERILAALHLCPPNQ
jgi:circadian clock protein KaiB